MLPLFSKPLEDIVFQDVRQLIDESYPEGATVEYKRELPSKGKDQDPWYEGKKSSSYARDRIIEEVVAFANADGGHVLLGIEESGDRPARAENVHPVPRCHDLAERLRMQIRDCIEPKIPLVTARGISSDPNGEGVVLIRVQASRLAPHRHTQTLHCYYRRADRSEKMTMREIHDLTFRQKRQSQRIDETFAAQRDSFRKWLSERSSSEGSGVRVTLVPVSELHVKNIYQNETAFPQTTKKMSLSVGKNSHSITIARIPHNERPILRGSRRESNEGSMFVTQEATREGVVELRLWKTKKEENKKFDLHVAWVLGLIANGLLSAEAFRSAAGAPEAEYAMEVELSRQPRTTNQDLNIHRLGSFPYNRDIPLPEPSLILPRLSFGHGEEKDQLLAIVLNDIRNAGGISARDEKLRVDWP